MKYAIIAAGEGSRLASEGIAVAKPLVPICGTPLIERLIKEFMQCDAESINIIINTRDAATRSLLNKLKQKFPITFIEKDTESSMHSLHALSPYLRGGKFCLTTVDTIFKTEEFRAYINEFDKSNCDGMMAVTDFIDDEKPLYVGTDEKLHITGFYDNAPVNAKYISGGIYGLDEAALDTLERCIRRGQSRMRNFQRELIADGLHLNAYVFGKIIDIDHASDIAKAEEFIK